MTTSFPKEAIAPRAIIVRADTAIISQSSPDADPSGEPHIILPARTAGGDPVVGFSFAMWPTFTGGADVGGAGFAITPFQAITTIGRWSSWATYSSYAYGQKLVCYDVGAGAVLWFQVAGALVDGLVEMAIEPLA